MSEAELAAQSMRDEETLRRRQGGKDDPVFAASDSLSPKLLVLTEIRVIHAMSRAKSGHREGVKMAWMYETMFNCFVRWQDVKDDEYSTFEIESGFNP